MRVSMCICILAKATCFVKISEVWGEIKIANDLIFVCMLMSMRLLIRLIRVI